jgi:glycosyltransferase involved in cell wall biosynthesis
VIGQVGSLLKRKGADVAIRAIAEPEPTARGVRLVLVGEGPEETKLRELSESLGVSDRVTFTGQDPNPLRFYQHVFDVNLLASRSEAMGLALLEGAACGLPGLGANAEGTPEALIDGESGFLFPSEDHEALARLIERLADDPGLRERMGRRAREIALERFTVERQVGEIDGVISRLLGEGARRRAKTPDPDR